ncbi:MAG: hypothetical protein AAF657_09950 [Acidobacteriota bacterium]
MDREAESGYDVISFQVHWASLSIVLFLLALPAKYLLGFLPWRPERIWLWPLIPPLVILGLSTLGLFSGWMGYKFTDHQGMAKAGMFLNGTVLAIVLAIVAFWFYIVSVR